MKAVIRYWPAFALIIIVVAVLWPVLMPGFFRSDDGEWMVIRLSAFYQSLREGQFPVRFLGRLNYNYGYPVANFLYPGFLYIGSLIKAFGFSFVHSVELVLGLAVAGIAVCWYRYLRLFFDRIASALGVLMLVAGPYLLYTLYHRGSVGEVLALFSVTLGFYALESGKKVLTAFSIALLVLSHNTMALLFFPLLVLYSLQRRRFSGLAFALGVGMAAFFWIPALSEQRYVVFSETAISTVHPYFISAETFTLLYPVVWVLALFIGRKTLPLTGKLFLGVFILASFGMSSLSAPFWSDLPSRIIQFPFRLGMLTSVSGSWIAAYVLTAKRQKIVKLALICVVYVFVTATYLQNMQRVEFIDRPDGYYSTNEATTTVADEYMPIWVKEKPSARPSQRAEVIQGEAVVSGVGLSPVFTQNLAFRISAQSDSVIRINTIYYPGWGVTLSGSPAPVQYQNKNGLIEIAVPKGDFEIHSAFRETPERFAANIISLGSFGSLVLLRRKRHEK